MAHPCETRSAPATAQMYDVGESRRVPTFDLPENWKAKVSEGVGAVTGALPWANLHYPSRWPGGSETPRARRAALHPNAHSTQTGAGPFGACCSQCLPVQCVSWWALMDSNH